MKVLHTYLPVDVPLTENVRWVVFELSHVFVRANGEEAVIPQEVWSTRAVHFADADAMSQTRRQAFEETCRRNGARPRRASFEESIALMAQLKALEGTNGSRYVR